MGFNMAENCYLYIVPIVPTLKGSINKSKEFGWIRKRTFVHYKNSHTETIKFNKKINHNGHTWDITFRKYLKINSAIFVIECSDTTYQAENFIDADNIFYKIKNECGVFGAPYVKKYIFRFFDNDEVLPDKINGLSYLFSEINGSEELHRINTSCFYLKTNCDNKLTWDIKDNIFLLLSLSDIAYYMDHTFLDGGVKNDNQDDIIKTFWGYKFLLFKGSASQKFPLFFKNNMLVINNLLDYRHMDLVGVQNNLLKEIHVVESGILYLTLVVLFDVVFTIGSEIMDALMESMGWEVSHLIDVSIPLILAIAVAAKIYKVMPKFNISRSHK